ncbi:ABC transporter permease [Brachyspira hampsonii 30446]|uniref:ABC transporter permease n=1 Tax=Brachyspira hampsonii 30446 TaxID=1289135 RepID=A0A2U4EVT5_9SPIR|nr:ABC transporter permease [Brachyspira hampsonii]EKV57028.1 ABC transporter permease [Brachyspira hampsonii 30446]MBW5393842.1 ABC transporter [Brachyspira hampsonii]OEJ20478.1 ABC transporter [Brachyspira hampsonii]
MQSISYTINKSNVILKKELRHIFFSPTAYIFSAIFLIVSGVYFFSRFFILQQNDMQDFFSILPLILSLIIPPITMGLLSSEFSSGSYELISTQSVSALEIILGKFFSAVIFMLFALIPTILYPITLSFLGRLDIGPVIAGYIGSVFLIMSLCAIGIFASSTTKNQIVALIVGLAIMISLNMFLRYLTLLFPASVNFIEVISGDYHFANIARGVLDLRDIIYFLSVTVIFIYLANIMLENRK